jgi:hypothetical protein
MATNQLTATSGSGEQTTTQSPQAATQPSTGGTVSSGVQPGTATSLLNGQGSVQLYPTSLPTVGLSGATGAAATGTVAAATPAKPVAKHHANPVLLGSSALLLVVAIVLFWITSRSVKTTT